MDLLFLSGGDDIGDFVKRDKTELALLKYMINRGRPVIGICKGMQLINNYFGGSISVGNDNFIKEHRATMHTISLNGSNVQVNSYHSNKINETNLNKVFSVIGRNISDNSIEAFVDENILGVMWHPEREKPCSKHTISLITEFLLKK